MWCTKILNRAIKAPQKSIAWLKARHNMLTSSEVASALDCNRYESSTDLLKKKVRPVDQTLFSTHATAWGEKYEPIAKRIFESDRSLTITDVGLVPHESIPWLGASPDGLVSDGRLIEIKCPFYRRVVKDLIPYHYWIQMQIQLEVCNVEECYFMQCVFEDNTMNFMGIPESGIPHRGIHVDNTEWYLKNYTLSVVKRDREWFKKIFPTAVAFWKKVEHYRIHGTGMLDADLSGEQAYMDLTTNTVSYCLEPRAETSSHEDPVSLTQVAVPIPEPRTDNLDVIEEPEVTILADLLSVEQPTVQAMEQPTVQTVTLEESKSFIENIIQSVTVPAQPKESIDWSEWVSPSDTRNYLMKDPLLDWLNMYGKNLITSNPKYNIVLKNYELDFKNSAPYLHYLVQSGNEFENAVISYMKKRFKNDIVTIAESHQARDPTIAAATVAAMKEGVPFIYHGLLHDSNTKTYGIADLIVRSDYINRLFTTVTMSASAAKHKCNLSDKWHYVIVDIKHSMLMLRADGIHLLNTGQAAAYKGQVYMYNEILSTIQGYKSNTAYILGRRWSYTTKGERFDGNGWFDRAGVVDFSKADANIPDLVEEAVTWIRRVRKEGSKWSINPPSNINLYPNMCNEQDTPWRSFKKLLAESIGEITSLWQCGINNRDIAFSNGIKSWRDKRCNAELVGICGPKQGPCLDAIINVNKQSNIAKILPKKISQKLPRPKIEFFLDFETSNDVSGPIDFDMPFTTSESFVYMIGLGWTVSPSNEWNYVCLTADSISQASEKEIFMAMHDKIFEVVEKHNALEDYIIYHWSNAERVIYESTSLKYYSDLAVYREHFFPTWMDLCDLFRQEPIVVKGALNFSLKSIAPAMYKHGFIETIWDENGVTDGLNAMIKAIECSEDSKRKGFVMSEHPIMKGIIKYNEVDCKVMMEILRYVRDHMTFESSREKSVVKSRLVGKCKQLAEAAGEETRFVHKTLLSTGILHNKSANKKSNRSTNKQSNRSTDKQPRKKRRTELDQEPEEPENPEEEPEEEPTPKQSTPKKRRRIILEDSD